MTIVRLGHQKWDHALLLDALEGRLAAGRMQDSGGEVVLACGGKHEGDVTLEQVQEHIDPLEWAVVCVVSDEAGVFPWRELRHPNMHVWVQTPRLEGNTGHDRFLLVGYPPDTTRILDGFSQLEHDLDWVFQGQVNHERRQMLVKRLRRLQGGLLLETPGFTLGDERWDYLTNLARSKIALCPSGPATPDTFRMAEALEAGCVPIIDAECPAGLNGFWPLVLGGDHPMSIAETWKHVDDLINYQLSRWPANANRCSAWWQWYKYDLQRRLHADVAELSGVAVKHPDTTVLIPTSPIPAHPSTCMIEQTVDSVRHWLPDAQIIVMCDGVRPEQEHYREPYEQYLNRLMWLCEHDWGNCVPLIFDEHTHQAGMARRAMELVDTPTITYVEHDCPIVTDCPIDWSGITRLVASGEVNVIRLAHEALILEVHENMMVDHQTLEISGVPLRRTVQWSQRPHVARSDYYRTLLSHSRLQGKTMIEDIAVSIVDGSPWGRHRIAVYHPDELNIKRSWTTDGRQDDPKFESELR